MLNYGVIGFGYWGPNLVRVISAAKQSRVAAICDRDPDQRDRAAALYPGVVICSDPEDLLSDPAIDVIAVATPVSTHYLFSKRALLNGKHIFVEKPLTASSIESADLLRLARDNGRLIFVDHTFLYTGAVQKILDIAAQGWLGTILYYDSVRVNLGLFQSDINVIWDLVVHDVAILDRLMPVKPVGVTAIASNPVAAEHACIAYVSLHYPGDIIAHVHASWLAPVKVRQTLIGGTKRMIVYDDLDPTEKIKLYDRGVEIVTDVEETRRLKVAYRAGDILSPQIPSVEALQSAVKHANECFLSGEQPPTGGAVGHRVVRILEAAVASAADAGSYTKLDLESA